MEQVADILTNVLLGINMIALIAVFVWIGMLEMAKALGKKESVKEVLKTKVGLPKRTPFLTFSLVLLAVVATLGIIGDYKGIALLEVIYCMIMGIYMLILTIQMFVKGLQMLVYLSEDTKAAQKQLEYTEDNVENN